jgi:hypothetical protein
MPNGDRHVYTFNIASASINSPLQKLQSFFTRPRLPGGWKRIVEPLPMEQAAHPGPVAR